MPVSQTENNTTNSSAGEGGGEERIRKVYVKDIKGGETLHTVFRATRKERHTSRAGKTYITMALVDRTGEVEARIFDNVDAADAAFQNDDYLLVQGKVGNFHGKSQLVVDTLERLDPGPIDVKEFTYVAPPAPAPVAAAADERSSKKSDDVIKELRLPRRVQKLLETPQVAQAFEALLGYVDRLVDEKVAARLGEKSDKVEKTERPDRPERHEKKPRGPRIEHKPAVAAEGRHEKPEPKRDASLPEGLAFKPFSQLVSPPEAAASPAPDEKPAAAPATEG